MSFQIVSAAFNPWCWGPFHDKISIWQKLLGIAGWILWSNCFFFFSYNSRRWTNKATSEIQCKLWRSHSKWEFLEIFLSSKSFMPLTTSQAAVHLCKHFIRNENPTNVSKDTVINYWDNFKLPQPSLYPRKHCIKTDG